MAISSKGSLSGGIEFINRMWAQFISRCRSRLIHGKYRLFRGGQLPVRGLAFLMGLGLAMMVLPAVALGIHPVPSQSLTFTTNNGNSGDRPQLSQLQVQPVEDELVTLLNQGRQLYQGGRFAEAVAVWARAANRYQQSGDRLNHSLSLNYLSLAYQELGEWEPAQKAIAQSLSLLDQSASPTRQAPSSSAPEAFSQQIFAQALNTRGSLQLAQGEPEAALDSWKQAESVYRLVGDMTGALGSQINQAQGMQVLGLYRRAQMLLEQVNQQLQSQPDSTVKVTGLRSLGNALQVGGDLRESQRVLAQSLAVAQGLKSTADLSPILLSLGNTARALQEREEALTYYQQAVTQAIVPRVKIDAQLNQLSLFVETQQWETARSLLNLVTPELATLPPSRAAVYARVNFASNALKLLEGSGSETISARQIAQILATAIQDANALQDPRAQSYALGELGYLYKRTHQLPEAQKLTQQALAIASSINATEIAARWQWQLGRILMQKGQTDEAIAAYTQAVESLAILRRDLVAISVDVQYSFQARVEPIYRELIGLLLNSNPTQGQLKQARETIEALQLAELEDFFRQACLDVQPVQIDEIDPSAAAIYPIILPDRLEVILSLPGQPLRHYATQLSATKVEGTLNHLLESLNPFFSNQERLQLSEQVYDWLIRPAETSLAAGNIKTLVFVLDGLLRNLPMAVLHDSQQYLIEKYSLALTPGLQLLAPQAIAREELRALTAGLTEARQGFNALPGVARELAQIASNVPSHTILNQEFTALALKQQIEQTSYPVVHLATHGQFSSNPEETFILTYDEKIQMAEFQTLLRSRENRRGFNSLHPIELLVLSACQTATGDNRAALGLAGFAVRSGARSTLATLWSVKDESTSQLMADFYREFSAANMSKAEALRRAQVALLHQTQYQHPFYWAPFILVGNWL